MDGGVASVSGVTPPYTAVILAGGAGRRMGGPAKPEIALGGRRLVDCVLSAVSDAEHRIVVGPPLVLPAEVQQVQEEPAGGGPVAALNAALPLVATGSMVLVAADLPFLTPAVIAALLRAAEGRDGALLVDGTGRDQLLLGAWSVAALQAAVDARPRVEGAALYGVLAGLDAARVSWEVPPGTAPPWWDCDSPADLDQARRWLGVTRTEGAR